MYSGYVRINNFVAHLSNRLNWRFFMPFPQYINNFNSKV
nr:MAG TPA: hypothetical protein [Caudoviricetes sp.]DAW18598.1 MAG TPA: hypothetical protein [Caudoviricetes sp.]